MKVLFSFIVIAILNFSFAQEINQFDKNGKRHGIWKKYHTNIKPQKLRYQGQFVHGKEIDTFKFYHKGFSKHPQTIKVFKADGTAEVTHYSTKGFIVSKGQMKGKLRIGKWLIYHKDSKVLMSEENYVNDKLHDERKVYYLDGTLTEKSIYKNGQMHGFYERFSDKGKKMMTVNYVNDKKNGEILYYHENGKVKTRGKYKMGKRISIWKYYDANGKLEKEEDYTKTSNPYKKK